MTNRFLIKLFLMSLIILESGGTIAGQGISTSLTGQSKWVYMNSEGKLAYKMTDKGDRIMDFSHAGYMGGGVTIPEVPVRITLYPSGSDDRLYRGKQVNAKAI